MIKQLTPQELDEMAYLGRDAFFQKAFRESTAFTFDDVTLATNFTNVLPKEAKVATQVHNLILPVPIFSADMDTVTEEKMAIAMAQNGGMGIIHYNMTPEEQIRQVAKVKNYTHGVIDTPITVHPNMLIGEVMKMREEKGYSFGTFPVVDENKKLIWLIGSSVLQEMHANRSVSEGMVWRTEILTMTPEELVNHPIEKADKFFQDNIWKNKILIVDKNNTLKGLITGSDIARIRKESGSQQMAQDSQHRLLVWAALPLWRNKDQRVDEDKLREHAYKLVEAWVDAIVLSSAHAHTESIGSAIRFVRSQFQDLTIIAGNVTSASGVEYLSHAGANVIKIGQGPGSICTTRIVAWVGIPQLSAIYIASKAAELLWVQTIADGGLTKSGDIVKAFAAWADAIMLGGLLGSSDEAPGKVIEIEWKYFKAYRGMGSKEAMISGSAARYGHSINDTSKKTAAEWISAAKPASGPVWDTLATLVWGVQSGMGYLWAKELKEIKEKARFIRMTTAGGIESRPHDVIEIKR